MQLLMELQNKRLLPPVGYANDKLKSILDTQFKNGKMVMIEIDLPSEKSPEKSDPWIDNIGIFQDDPTFDEFLSEVNAYRNEIDRIEAHQ